MTRQGHPEDARPWAGRAHTRRRAHRARRGNTERWRHTDEHTCAVGRTDTQPSLPTHKKRGRVRARHNHLGPSPVLSYQLSVPRSSETATTASSLPGTSPLHQSPTSRRPLGPRHTGTAGESGRRPRWADRWDLSEPPLWSWFNAVVSAFRGSDSLGSLGLAGRG